MNDAGRRIKDFQRRVMWRKRWLALQDAAARLLLIAGPLAAAVAGYAKLRPAEFQWGIVAGAVFIGVASVLITRWLRSLAASHEAAFEIDRRLALEDRIPTASGIIEQGEFPKPIEAALIEDAASRLSRASAASVIPYRFPRWYALSVTAVIALAVALMLPQKTLPGAQELVAERAEIQGAGEQLEQASKEVEKIAPAGSETANLAREQAELGLALRRAPSTRAEALRKLSALGDRIRQRHDELAETHADEVVTMAERRLRSPAAAKANARQDDVAQTISEAPATQTKERQVDAARERKSGESKIEAKVGDSRQSPGGAKSGENSAKAQKPGGTESTDNESKGRQVASKEEREARKAEDGLAKGLGQSGVAGQTTKENDASAQQPRQPDVSKPDLAPADDQKGSGQLEKENDSQSGDKKIEPPNGLTGAVAEQAAKVLPGLSEQLLKKAQQLRANELKPEDIKQLQQAAQFLARDLAKIAQSKEFQQTVEQLAKQVNPEQLEQVARELAKQEDLKRELEAAARLMMENQQVRDAVAGIAQQFAEQAERFRPRMSRSRDWRREGKSSSDSTWDGVGRDTSRNRPRSPGGKYERAAVGDRLQARGPEEKLSGKLRRSPGGEYLYLSAKPGAGTARAAYSSAYPQYRRAAERSVERSQVPQRMRSMVRDYFDAINPDVSKKP